VESSSWLSPAQIYTPLVLALFNIVKKVFDIYGKNVLSLGVGGDVA